MPRERLGEALASRLEGELVDVVDRGILMSRMRPPRFSLRPIVEEWFEAM